MELAWTVGELAAALHPVPRYLSSSDVFEGGDGRPVRYHDIVQDNYGATLQSQQVVRTFYPQTRYTIQIEKITSMIQRLQSYICIKQLLPLLIWSIASIVFL